MTEHTENILWEDAPAEAFHDAHLIGNGRIGASVFGTFPDEKIVLNEDTLWSGGEGDILNLNARNHLNEVRQLVFAGKYAEAQNILDNEMLGIWGESYEPACTLNISTNLSRYEQSFFHNKKQLQPDEAYIRKLDISTALSTVAYTSEGIDYTREYFVSHPAQVLMIRLRASQPVLDAFLSFDCDLRHEVAASHHQLALTGRAPDHVEPTYSYVKPIIAYKSDQDSDSIRYAVTARILHTDGTVRNEAYRLFITGAREVVIAVAIHSNYAGYQVRRDNRKSTVLNAAAATLDGIIGRSYDDLYAEHVRDYQSLYNRMTLSLSPQTTSQLPTSQRLAALSSKMDDPSLFALILNYDRYLLISSSRQGTQAANLQGIWNAEVRPPWSSNYTTNINVQMNYWIAESLNLAECHLPLITLIEELAQSGTKTAREYFDMDGWTAGHNTDLWRKSSLASGTASWAYWPMAGLWLCQHLWQHYEFTQDKAFLKNTALPLMKGAAQFVLDYMVEDEQGYLVTCPTTSPENNFFIPGIRSRDAQILKSISPRNRMIEARTLTCAISASSTMDITMTRELLEHYLQAVRISGMESDFDAKVHAVLGKLPPLKIGQYGQLQEWGVDFEECAPAMGHMSHLYGLYPGDLITSTKNTEYFRAGEKSLMRRFAHGGLRAGWPGAWALCLFARLKNQAMCGVISNQVTRNLGANMLSQNSTQIDAVFGIGAGVTEMLLQSHDDCIEFIPSIPHSWVNGHFKAFVARGGFEVSCAWSKGTITSAQIRSRHGLPCCLKLDAAFRINHDGAPLPVTLDENNRSCFDTRAGETYNVEII